MPRRSIGKLIQHIAAILLAATVISTVALTLVMALEEVNRRLANTAQTTLLRFLGAIFVSTLNIMAASADALQHGARIGLAAGGAISLAYLAVVLLMQGQLWAWPWRLVSIALLAEAGALGAGYLTRQSLPAYTFGFAVGAAILGSVMGLFLTRNTGGGDGDGHTTASSPALLTRLLLMGLVVAGAFALFIF